MDAIETFDTAFAPYGLPPTGDQTLLRHRRGDPRSCRPSRRPPEPTVVHFDREQLAGGRAVRVAADGRDAVAQVSCGQMARSQWAVIVDPEYRRPSWPTAGSARSGCTATTLPRAIGDGPRKPGRRSAPRCSLRLHESSHARRLAGRGDVAADRGPRGVPGRRALRHRQDRGSRDRRRPQPLPAGHRGHHRGRLAHRAAGIRRGVLVPATAPRLAPYTSLVIVAERASGTRRADPRPAIDAIRAAVSDRHGLEVADVRFVPAGALPAPRAASWRGCACRDDYLLGEFGEL